MYTYTYLYLYKVVLQFSNVPKARLVSLGKIQIRVSFGDLESKGISAPLRRFKNPCYIQYMIGVEVIIPLKSFHRLVIIDE